MRYNIFDRRRRSVYSTNDSTLPLVIQSESKPRSRFKLFKIVNPTIIILFPENASNDTVTGLNWMPGTDKMDTYRTPARFPVFEWVLYQEHTFTDKRQNTRNRRQNRFLPLYKTDFDCRFFVLILFLGPGIRRWNLKIREQFWYKLLPYSFKLLPYLLVNPTVKISLIDWFWIILRFHLLIPGPTNKISTKNRQSKSVCD